jgi:CO/xanthine dehydrogenase Mo-binding subunit
MTPNEHPRPSVGSSPPRVDGVAKVTGAAVYVDDIAPEGVQFGRTLRSQVPHGVLRGVWLEPGFDWTDVTVVTAEDLPGPNVVALIEDDQPALVPIGGTIRHREEALALVAAPTRERAAEALRHVRVQVEPLHPVLSIDDALAGDVTLRSDTNVCSEITIHKADDDLDAVLAGCDHVIEATYQTGAQEQMYIEPQGMLATWNGDTVRVTGSLQCPYYIHKALCVLFELPAERVEVVQAVTGGGFGGKEEYPSMLAAHASLLSRKAARPVKMIYGRGEDIAATTKRHPARVHHRLGFSADGTLVAADIDVVLDGGAYATLSAVVLSRGVLHAPGPYRIPHVRVRGRVVLTNHPPHGAFRGFGAPQTVFACERQMDEAARAVGMDAMAFRRLNMLRAGDATATGQVLDESVGGAEVLDAVETALTAPGPSVAPRLGTLPSPVRRGRGLAFWFHGAGFTGSGEQRLMGQATVATRADGGFEVRSSSADIGQGVLTIFTQIAADALGVGTEHVIVPEPDTARVPDSGPTVASRTCMIVGKVVERAATALRQRLESWAGDQGLDADDLCAVAARHHADVGEAAETTTYEPPANVQWDDATYSGAAYPVYGWAACLVDLAVDDDTREVVIERCLHAVDVGHAIHRKIVQGQIEGGTLQALGWALLESVPYDDGRVANPSMTDSIIPTSFDAPELETLIVEVPYTRGPHGAKGVGEIPMDGPAAAVANALRDAYGVAFDELPLLPEVIERLVSEAGTGATT